MTGLRPVVMRPVGGGCFTLRGSPLYGAFAVKGQFLGGTPCWRQGHERPRAVELAGGVTHYGGCRRRRGYRRGVDLSARSGQRRMRAALEKRQSAVERRRRCRPGWSFRWSHSVSTTGRTCATTDRAAAPPRQPRCTSIHAIAAVGHVDRRSLGFRAGDGQPSSRVRSTRSWPGARLRNSRCAGTDGPCSPSLMSVSRSSPALWRGYCEGFIPSSDRRMTQVHSLLRRDLPRVLHTLGRHR